MPNVQFTLSNLASRSIPLSSLPRISPLGWGLLVLFLGFHYVVFAQQFTSTYSWGKGGGTNPSPVAELTFSNMSISSGLTSAPVSGGFGGSSWALDPSAGETGTPELTGSIDLDKYVEFSVTVSQGYMLNLSALTIGISRSSNGPRNFELRTNLDNFAAPVSNYSALDSDVTNDGGVLLTTDTSKPSGFVGNEADLSGASYQSVTGTIVFRLYGYNSETANGTGGYATSVSLEGEVSTVSIFTIANTGTPAATNILQGADNVILFGFSMSPNTSLTFSAVEITVDGTMGSNDIEQFRLIRDNDENGEFSIGDDELDLVASYANPLVFDGFTPAQSDFSAQRNYLVVADIKPTASIGRNITLSIASGDDVTTTAAQVEGSAQGNAMSVVSEPVGTDFPATYSWGGGGNTSSFAYNGATIANLTFSDATKVGVTSTNAIPNGFSANQWPEDPSVGEHQSDPIFSGNLDENKYYSISITVSGGYVLNLDSLTFSLAGETMGPRTFQWRSNADNFAAPITDYSRLNDGVSHAAGVLTKGTNSVYAGNTLDLSGIDFQELTGTITFRFYGYNAGNASGSGGFGGNISVFGEVVEESSITISDAGSPSAQNLPRDSENAVVFGFALTPNEAVNISSIDISVSGTATSDDISNFTLIHDANANGEVDEGDETLATRATLTNPLSFSDFDPAQTGISAKRRYLLTADISAQAFIGSTFSASIISAGAITSTASQIVGTATGNATTFVTNLATQQPGSVSVPFTWMNRGEVSPFPYNGAPITGMSVSALGRVGVSSVATTPNVVAAEGWELDASAGEQATYDLSGTINLAKYLELSLTVDAGYTFHLDSLVFDLYRSANGPRQWQWRSSLDSYASAVTSYTRLNEEVTHLSGVVQMSDTEGSFAGNTLNGASAGWVNVQETTLTLRLYGYNAETETGLGGIGEMFVIYGRLLDDNAITASVTLTGTAGWRMFSSPIQQTTFSTFLDGVWSQGFNGAAGGAQDGSNVFLFDVETNQFSAPTDASTVISAGQGFIAYIYADDNPLEEGVQGGFPKNLDLYGLENEGSISPTLNQSTDGWTLLGNPFYSAIDWDQISKSNVQNSVYVWDSSTSSYLVYNGITGSLEDGVIPAFNGFWVQNSGGRTPSIGIPEAAKVEGGTFLGKKKNLTETVMMISSGEQKSQANIVFTNDASVLEYGANVPALYPLAQEWIQMGLVIEEESTTPIQHAPIPSSETSFPLFIQATHSDSVWFSVSQENIPQHWNMYLHEVESDQRYLLDAHSPLRTKAMKASQTHNKLLPQTMSHQKVSHYLVVEPTTATGLEEIRTTWELTLHEAWPNPFNPTTQIAFSLPQAMWVSVSVLDLNGRQIARLVSEEKPAGRHQITWDAGKNASGIYLLRMDTPQGSFTKKLTLIK